MHTRFQAAARSLRSLFVSVPGIRAMAIGLAACIGAVQANPVNISYLDGQLRVSPDSITAYGHDLFGDKVNLFNGSLEFEHTDLSLPGNSALPVALVRKHVPGRSEVIRGPLGDWDLEVPRIGGSFSGLEGWVTAARGTNRCSGFSLPPIVSSGTGRTSAEQNPEARTKKTAGLPVSGAASVPKDIETVVGFIASDYWQGTQLHVPGHGVQEVLNRAPGYAWQPTDGAAYPLVTRNNWQITCLPAVLNHTGEGFLAVSPDGVRYRFDWMATRLLPGAKKAGASISRQEMFLMATEVSDRFGNWVRYTYDPANPQQLRRIESNDGRVITLTYSGGRLSSAFDGTRTYFYDYTPFGNLQFVRRPDGSRWTFNLAPMVALQLATAGEGATCDSTGDFPIDVLTGTITHPSGAVGSFTTSFTMLGRTYVDRVCTPHPLKKTLSIGSVYPRYVNTQALTAKEITGPGLTPMRWTFEYNAPGGWTTCTNCPEVRTTVVTEPDSSRTRHTFGNRWRVNEGQLLQLEEGWNGSTALRTTTYRYRTWTNVEAFPDQFGTSLLPKADWLASRLRPQDKRTIVQQGHSFNWEALPDRQGIDYLARPLQVRKFSTLGYTRTDAVRYDDNARLWVLGQMARLVETSTGIEVESHDYDVNTALPLRSRQFGRITHSYLHNTDGTLDTIRDAASRATRLTNWRRGKPQQITHRDNNVERQVINNLGDADSQTNAALFTTHYRYDLMGRVDLVTYPAGFPTTQTFERLATPDDFGLPAGHWKQTISTGNARKVRYFDALWRERLSYTLDAANPSGTRSVRESRYDLRGAKSFESYPFRLLDTPRPGTTTLRDALSRVTTQISDSEHGPLTRTSVYPDRAFQRIDTNARLYATVFDFQAFDEPTTDRIVSIQAPESVVVSMPRDLFGKPTSITRGGGGYSVTRRYAYDQHQRLCMTVEPESGATLQGHDTAGNVAWRESGISPSAAPTCSLVTAPLITSVTSGSVAACSQVAAPSPRRILFVHDARNRPVCNIHGDGSPLVARSYTPDGLPETIATPTSTWTLGYNSRRLMESETFSSALGTYAFGYGIDSYGNVASMSYPGGPALFYNPDALGRPTQIAGYLNNITYHPNGQVTGYTAANGVAYTMTPNVRGLPETLRHGTVASYRHAYDEEGNVTAIIDEQVSQATRSMGYDGLDRLTSANGVWGIGQFSYDTLDNMRTSRIGTRVLTHQYDATNRLVGVTGSGSAAVAYDLNGNVTTRGAQTYVFDIANRMTSAINVANYYYDGNGRRAGIGSVTGRTTLRMYGQSGRLLMTSDSVQGVTRHIYLGDKVVAETNPATGTRWMHTDVLGSPVAATGAGGNQQVLEWTRYEPYGLTAGGTNPTGIGFTGHVNDVETGLVYMQQRYYDPIAGRFLSVDPVTTDAGNGALFNRYMYAANNPFTLIDPDGRCTGSRITNSDGTCKSTGGFTTGTDGMAQGMQRERAQMAQVAQAPAGAANAPGGPYIEPTWKEIGAVADGVATAASITPLGVPVRAAKAVTTIAGATFKTGHYASRLEAAGVNVARAEAAVAKEVGAMRGNMATNADVVGRLTVDGVKVEYRARMLPNGTVNVGTLFPVK